MITGDPAIFAIESEILHAYAEPGSRALGFFVVHIHGRRYGVREPDATMLACSFDAVSKRIADRNTHTAAFSAEPDPHKIAHAFREAIYADEQAETYFGKKTLDFVDGIYSKNIQWAPDGDEAFDDCSYILQFDIGDQVRLLAFKSSNPLYDPSTLSDMSIDADQFYEILQRWRDAFLSEWQRLPKIPR